MEQLYSATRAELIELRNIKVAHAIFLKLVEKALIQVAENNKIIFRRIPDSRLKTSKSILKKFANRKNKSKEFIPFVKDLKDLAGLRMTITTKDEFDLAKKILLTSPALKGLGHLDTESRVENGVMNERGYCAHHYFLHHTINLTDSNPEIVEVIADTIKTAKVTEDELSAEYSVTAEIQIRTLAQDLWAVFEHPERYKGNGTSEILDLELLNYAKLMNVADDIAQLTKNRKVHEAENYSRKKRGNVPIGSKELLTVDVLRRELSKVNDSSENLVFASTFELCDLLMQLADNGVFTSEDLLDLIGNQEYRKAIESAFEVLSIRRDEMEVAISDYFQLFFFCRTCQAECENLKSKQKNVEHRMLERDGELKRKICEIKSESDLSAVINNFEVKRE